MCINIDVLIKEHLPARGVLHEIPSDCCYGPTTYSILRVPVDIVRLPVEHRRASLDSARGVYRKCRSKMDVDEKVNFVR